MVNSELVFNKIVTVSQKTVHHYLTTQRAKVSERTILLHIFKSEIEVGTNK